MLTLAEMRLNRALEMEDPTPQRAGSDLRRAVGFKGFFSVVLTLKPSNARGPTCGGRWGWWAG